MSRRHRGRARSGQGRPDDAARTQAMLGRRDDEMPRPTAPEPRSEHGSEARGEIATTTEAQTSGHAPASAPAATPMRIPAVAQQPAPESPATPAAIVNTSSNGDAPRNGCTAPQLRRFIKSRPYVPMHELRRRFGINGTEDDVHPLEVEGGPVFVGLPERECALLGELVRGGEVGYELSLDPRTPIVVGVYPMRPVPRA